MSTLFNNSVGYLCSLDIHSSSVFEKYIVNLGSIFVFGSDLCFSHLAQLAFSSHESGHKERVLQNL